MDADLERYELAWNCGLSREEKVLRQIDVDAHNAEVARQYEARNEVFKRASYGNPAAIEQLKTMPPITDEMQWDLFTDLQKVERNAKCEAMADEYVAAHPELQAYRGLTIPECAAVVESARNAGDFERMWRMEIWINHRFVYQLLGGHFGGGQIRDINVDGDTRSESEA